MLGSGVGTGRVRNAIVWEACGVTLAICSITAFPFRAWDRSRGNGFRCAVYPEGTPPSKKLFRDIEVGFYDPYSIPAYSKEVFQVMKAMYAYPQKPLNPAVESYKEAGRGWKTETVSINAAYAKDRLILHIDLPSTGEAAL